MLFPWELKNGINDLKHGTGLKIFVLLLCSVRTQVFIEFSDCIIMCTKIVLRSSELRTDVVKLHICAVQNARFTCLCRPPTEQALKPNFPQQKLVQIFTKHLDDHEKKFGRPVPDKAVYLEAPWPKNVLQHVLAAYHQRTSFIGSLSRSRTSLNLISAGNTPNLDRRRSISPGAQLSKSAVNTTNRGKLSKANRYASTSNLKLVSEKISGFSVFSGSDELREASRQPIMAYGDDVMTERQHRRIDEEPRKSLERSRPVEKIATARRNSPALNRQTLSEQHLKVNHNQPMKRSISQQSLKQDIALEAVMIDVPIDGKYDTMKSTSTFASSSQDGSEIDFDGITSKYFSRWGPVRGSNSYSNSADVPVSQLSTLNVRKSIIDDKNDGPPDSIA